MASRLMSPQCIDDCITIGRRACPQFRLNDKANGGIGGYSGGYCPYTTDRSCRIEAVGNFDPNNEICQDCGWRAW